ncbi:MAG TPA: hypothetical protein VLT35_04360 [Methanocella sp.]|nr:hypothetical protein [Methanocella sp.]
MGLKKWAIAILLVLMLLSQATPALGWAASKMGGVIGDIAIGDEFVVQRPSATLFHTQTAAATDTEAFALAFPTAESDVIGPGTTAFNLGLPTIAQTSTATGVATDSGFFKANWCYTSALNAGGYALCPDCTAWHPMKSPYMAGSGISWPYMNNAPLYGEAIPTMTFHPAIDTSAEQAGQPVTFRGSSNISSPASIANATKGATKVATPNRDYKNMTKEDIRGMTDMEKMYRNSNLKNTMPLTYRGTIDQPSVIDPLATPMDIIKPANKPLVLKDSLAMTQAGTQLKTLFWDL